MLQYTLAVFEMSIDSPLLGMKDPLHCNHYPNHRRISHLQQDELKKTLHLPDHPNNLGQDNLFLFHSRHDLGQRILLWEGKEKQREE